MGAVLKIFSFLGSAVGLVVWLGGTALVAFALTSAMGESQDDATALAKIVVVIAGVVVAFIASVVLLRVTRNLIWFFVCFACGAFAALAGAGFSPANLSGDMSIFAVGALAILGVSVVVLALTKRMVPFLVCLGLLGIAGAAASSFIGLRAPGPAEVASGASVDSAPATDYLPAPDALPREGSAAGGALTTEDLAAAQENDNLRRQSDQAAAARAENDKALAESARTQAEIQAGAGAPADGVGSRDQSSGGGMLGGVLGRALPPAAGPSGEPATAAPRQRPASRSLRPPGAETAAPSPPPPAAAPESAPEMAEAAPPPPAASDPGAVIADAKPSDFQTAELKFNKPEKMEIDTSYTVSATIAGALAEAQATLGNVGPTVSRAVNITRKVRVELVASDFDIKKLHTVDTVLITPETSGQWSWDVTPRRLGGDRKMLLQVYGVIERDGVPQGETLIKTYEETIPVQVTPMARVRLVSQGIVERWQPIAGALGVIGGIWVFLQKLLGAFTRRRKGKIETA